jgi:hypothetical protein
VALASVVALSGAVVPMGIVALGSVVALRAVVGPGNVVSLTNVVALGDVVALTSVNVTLTSVVAADDNVALACVAAWGSVVTFDNSVTVVALPPLTVVAFCKVPSVAVVWIAVVDDAVAFPRIVAPDAVAFDTSGVPVVFDSGAVATDVVAFITAVELCADVPLGVAVVEDVPFAEGANSARTPLPLPIGAIIVIVVAFACVVSFVGKDDSDVVFPKAAWAVVNTPVVGVVKLRVALDSVL